MVEIAEDVSLVLIGDGAFDLHDGLQQHGGGEAQDFAEGVSCGQEEGLVVDLFVRSVMNFADLRRLFGLSFPLSQP